MTTTILEERRPTLPSKEDTARAKEASQVLAKVRSEELRVRLDDKELVLPKAATALIHHLLTEMSLGNAVTIIPIHAELSTQEAADFLNVSRPHLIRMLEQGKIRYHKVGTHRRIRFEDLVAYKKAAEAERREKMSELAEQAQELGMGY